MHHRRRAAAALALVLLASGCSMLPGRGRAHPSPFDPDAPEVVAARDRSAAAQIRRVDELGKDWTPSGDATVTHACRWGTHNWKVNDAYDVQCLVTVRRVFGTHQDYPGVVDVLTPRIAAQGWAPSGEASTLAAIEAGYYEGMYLVCRRNPCSRPSPPPPSPDPHEYRLSSMPPARYEISGEQERLDITVAGDGEPWPPGETKTVLLDHPTAVVMVMTERYFMR